MKEKLRKHRYSVLVTIGWGLLGYSLIAYVALSFFPFVEDGMIKISTYPMLFGASITYALLVMILARVRAHPTATSPLVVNSIATIFSLFLFASLAASRVYFSLGFLTFFALFTNVWFLIEFLLRSRFASYTFAIVPGGYDLMASRYPNSRMIALKNPEDLSDSFDCVIVDFEQHLEERWIAFVSQCLLEGVPVVSTDDFIEAQRGIIILEHLTTGRGVVFQTGSYYPFAKRVFDLLFLTLAFPLWLIIMLATAVLIRLESRGPVIFTQKRVGQGGRAFTIYKFRSMSIDAERDGAAFASKNDARVTRIGAFIRKFRIDELPQFVNIFKGDMSLIGPRPEQVPFVKDFEGSIPYYQLRHIVKPGITGWAQVSHGYAADAAETSVKLAHDLYYVKRLSLSLDFLIVVKTIGTILTGFGAR